jgi:DNA-binding transcriptional ArsR family regulator
MASPIEKLQERTGLPSERARVLRMTDSDADEALDALSSDTGRTTYRVLFDEPGTASELAERLDTSVQNVHYHLSNLQEAGLVEPIDTVYSQKGNEMTVYGPATDPLVFVGDDDRVPVVRQSLSGLVGGLALLAVASLLVQWGGERLYRAGGGPGAPPAGSAGPLSVNGGGAPTGTLTWLVFDLLEPGLVFFAGCLVAAAVAVVVARR